MSERAAREFALVPTAALPAWRALVAALGDTEPTPCQVADDTELWWSPLPERSDRAVQACRGCPVAGECLAYAMDGRERFGIWAGTTPDERRELTADARTHSQLNARTA